MKYSQPTNDRALGGLDPRRSCGNGLYGSRRDTAKYAARPSPLSADAKLFAWLFSPQGVRSDPLVPLARLRAR